MARKMTAGQLRRMLEAADDDYEVVIQMSPLSQYPVDEMWFDNEAKKTIITLGEVKPND